MLLAPRPGDTGITINNVTTTGGRHEAQHFRSAHQEMSIVVGFLTALIIAGFLCYRMGR